MAIEPALVWVQPTACTGPSLPSCMGADQQSAQPQPPALLEPSEVDADLQGKMLLLVLCGAPGRRRILRRLHATGLEIVCYSHAPARGWAADYIQQANWITGPLDDDAAAVSLMQKWLASDACEFQQHQAQQHQQEQQQHQQRLRQRRMLHGVMCYDEYGVQLAATLGQALGLPFASPAVAAQLRCKHLFRSVCEAGGVPCPKFMRLDGPLRDDDDHSMKGIRFPVVAKPTSCAGSFSVERCDSLAELRGASKRFFDAVSEYLKGIGLGRNAAGGMVVEELVVGHEVDIDCIVVQGQLVFAAVSDNHPPPAGEDSHTFMERGGRSPSTLPHTQQVELFQLARDVVGLWGSGLSGVFHLEAFATPTGAMPIELNGRIGGAETYTNILEVWGIDLGIQAARIALGYPPQLPPLPPVLSAPMAVAAVPCEPAAEPTVTLCNVPGLLDRGDHVCHVGDGQGQLDQLLLEQHVGKALPLSEELLAAQQRQLQDSTPSPSCITCSTCSSRSSCDHTPHGDPAVFSHLLTLPEAPEPSHSLTHPETLASHPITLHDGVFLHPVTLPESVSHLAGEEKADNNGPGREDVTGTSRTALSGGGQGGAWQGVFLGGWPALQAAAGCDGERDGCVGPVLPCDLKEQPRSADAPARLAAEPETVCGPPALSPGASNGSGTPAWGEAAGVAGGGCVRLARPRTHVHSVNFVPDWRGAGVVQALEVGRTARGLECYVDAELYVGAGAVVKLPPAGFSALGWMVARGRNAQEAEAAMQRVMEDTHIRIGHAHAH